MGELIYLDDRRKHRSRPAPDAAPAFFFDLACPESYLTAERIERTLGSVRVGPGRRRRRPWRAALAP